MTKQTHIYRLHPISVQTCCQLLAVTLLVLASTFPAKAQFINGSFIKGCNLAWENGNYNTWLGLDPTQPTWGVTYNSGDLNSYMANMHNMGITVLRVWVNEGDMGDTVNGSDYVTGVTSTWSSNFANMVQLASNNGIALYVTLNNGRADWLNNPAQAASYLNNALIPLIKQYKGNSAIFAIDLMNEIDGVVGGPLGNYGSGPTWAQAQSYIKTFAAAIHSADPGRKVSCSTGWHQWNNLSNFKGLGLDFYDFHNYQDTPSFPSASSLGMDKPIYIGECGQGTQSWNDSIQNTCELDALNSAFSQGYAGVGIWDYAYAGSTEVFSMINPNGTNRPVCATIQNWKAGGGGGGSNLISNGTYTIVGQNSGMALDDPGSSTADGTKMDQWTVNGGNNQKWQLINEGNNVVELVNVASGKALDVPNNSTTAGTDIDQWDVNGGNNQRWTVVSKGGGYYELVNVNSGMALDVVGASKTAGALIDQWNVSGNANQLWKFQ